MFNATVLSCLRLRLQYCTRDITAKVPTFTSAQSLMMCQYKQNMPRYRWSSWWYVRLSCTHPLIEPVDVQRARVILLGIICESEGWAISEWAQGTWIYRTWFSSMDWINYSKGRDPELALLSYYEDKSVVEELDDVITANPEFIMTVDVRTMVHPIASNSKDLVTFYQILHPMNVFTSL